MACQIDHFGSFEEEIFDTRAHFASSREGSWAEADLIFFSYFSILSYFVFVTCNDRLEGFNNVGSGRTIEASYCSSIIISNIVLI